MYMWCDVMWCIYIYSIFPLIFKFANKICTCWTYCSLSHMSLKIHSMFVTFRRLSRKPYFCKWPQPRKKKSRCTGIYSKYAIIILGDAALESEIIRQVWCFLCVCIPSLRNWHGNVMCARILFPYGCRIVADLWARKGTDPPDPAESRQRITLELTWTHQDAKDVQKSCRQEIQQFR